MQRVSDAAIDVLRSLTHNGDLVTFPQLERNLYLEVVSILESCGAAWVRRRAGHVKGVQWDPGMLADVIVTREAPPKNPLAFFPTPEKLAKWMAEHCGCASGGIYIEGELYASRILEPSAGTGALVKAFIDHVVTLHGERCCEIVMVEADPRRARILERTFADPPNGITIRVVCEDFAKFAQAEIEAGNEFDAILANPPFSLPGDRKAWRTHLRLMLQLLAKYARIAIILPANCCQDRDIETLQFVGGCHKECNAAGAFKESGTGVATTIYFGNAEDLLEPKWDGQSLWVENSEEMLKHVRQHFQAHGCAMTPQLRTMLLDFLVHAAMDGEEQVLFDDAHLELFRLSLIEHFGIAG